MVRALRGEPGLPKDLANVAASLPSRPASATVQSPQRQLTEASNSAECWWEPFARIGDAVIFHVDLTPLAAREAKALEWLDQKEMSRHRRFLYPGPRRRFALCRAALRALLCDKLDCRNDRLEFGASEYDKPFALLNGATAPVSFNVSHSGKHGMIAIASTGRLGIDVEEISDRSDLDGIIEMAFGPAEKAELALMHGSRRLQLFYKLWTIKESLIKAVGMGLSMDMSRFEVPPAMRRGSASSILELSQMPTSRWRLEYLGGADFAAALAHEVGPDSSPGPAI